MNKVKFWLVTKIHRMLLKCEDYLLHNSVDYQGPTFNVQYLVKGKRVNAHTYSDTRRDRALKAAQSYARPYID